LPRHARGPNQHALAALILGPHFELKLRPVAIEEARVHRQRIAVEDRRDERGFEPPAG
jgi:hypothetical protein